ncbi:hypothetical protein DIPPA_07886 [Diplonema papillatum]|nr:hypothetical protein DIPPA_07886 [Diplonema papillatum]
MKGPRQGLGSPHISSRLVFVAHRRAGTYASRSLPTACFLRSRLLFDSPELPSSSSGTKGLPRFDERFGTQHFAHHHQYYAQRRSWTNVILFVLGGVGWVLFITTLYTMNDLFTFLQFLDVAFPRKWHNLRLCFDLLPPEEKMEIVTDFRSMQLKGYDDSLFEFLQQYYPEAVSAQGLTPDETLRRLSYINRLVYEHGAESEHRWVELVKKVQRHQNLSQKERLSELLEKAPKAVVDSTGVPVYTGKNIYDDMPDEVSTEIAAETGKTTSSPSSGWRFM